MALKFECPHCQSRLSAEPELYGVQVDCPECSQALIVPNAEEVGANEPTEEFLKFLCPHCTRRISAMQRHFGRELPCPHQDCQKPVLVPRPDWKPIPTTLLVNGSANVNDLVEKAKKMTRKSGG